MNSLDELFRNEILTDLEEDVFLDDESCMVEAVMSDSEHALLDEASIVKEDSDLEDFLDELDTNDEIDDLMDEEEAVHEF